MKVCACSNAGTSKCSRCFYANLHLGDIPALTDKETNIEMTRLKGQIVAAYIRGAADYGGTIVHPENVDIEELLKDIE